MRAVVLVGGFGTRLQPLTLTTPKQMLPVVHRPMIEHVLGHLARYGIDDVVLSLGYRPEAFTDVYPDGTCAGVRLHYAVDPEPLDTAGAIGFAATAGGIDQRFVVVNGDVLTDLDVSRLVAFHDERGAEATIALHKVDDPSAFGVVPTDEHGRVTAFVEKPPREEAPTDLINAGTYVLEPSVIGRIPGGRPVSIERVTFPAMASEGTLFAMDGGTYWLDTGTPAQYLRCQLDLLDGSRGHDAGPGVHPDAVVDPGATVDLAVIGPGARVGAGAVVRRSVVMAGAVVAEGAHLSDAVVAANARIGVGARLADLTVIGERATVVDGEQLSGVRRPDPQAT